MEIPMRSILLATSVATLIASTVVYAGNLAATPSTDNRALEIIYENHKGEQGRVVIDDKAMIRAENEKNNAHYLLVDPDEPSLWLIDMGVSNGWTATRSCSLARPRRIRFY